MKIKLPLFLYSLLNFTMKNFKQFHFWYYRALNLSTIQRFWCYFDCNKTHTECYFVILFSIEKKTSRSILEGSVTVQVSFYPNKDTEEHNGNILIQSSNVTCIYFFLTFKKKY